MAVRRGAGGQQQRRARRRARRRGGGRLGVRRLGRRLPAGGGGPRGGACSSAGSRYPPGSFARTPAAMGRSFWDPSEGLHGLFDVWTFRGLEGVVSSGLGGGSLIYANVLLRKDEAVVRPRVARARRRLRDLAGLAAATSTRTTTASRRCSAPRPTPTPGTTAKTAAMRDSAARLGLDWQLPPLAVTFAEQPGGTPVTGAPIPLRGLREPARAAPVDLPAVRRVRHRLQRRREEHPRPHLPLGGRAPRRRPAHPVRGPWLRPAARRRVRGALRRPRRRPTRAGARARASKPVTA